MIDRAEQSCLLNILEDLSSVTSQSLSLTSPRSSFPPLH